MIDLLIFVAKANKILDNIFALHLLRRSVMENKKRYRPKYRTVLLVIYSILIISSLASAFRGESFIGNLCIIMFIIFLFTILFIKKIDFYDDHIVFALGFKHRTLTYDDIKSLDVILYSPNNYSKVSSPSLTFSTAIVTNYMLFSCSIFRKKDLSEMVKLILNKNPDIKITDEINLILNNKITKIGKKEKITNIIILIIAILVTLFSYLYKNH